MKRYNLKFLVILLLLIPFSPGALGADSDTETEKKAEFVRLTQEEIHLNNYAIVIGIDKYKYIRPQLPPCEKDAIDFRDKLIDFGWNRDNIQLFLDRSDPSIDAFEADRSSLMDAFERVCNPELYEEAGTLVIYFSGHGGAVDGDYFLYPVGGRLTTNDITRDTNFNFNNFLGKLTLYSRFQRNVLIIDACRSEADKAGGDSYKAIDGSKLSNSSGMVLVLSSQRNRSSYASYEDGNSFFTHHFLRGMESGIGVVTVQDAFDYAEKEMKDAIQKGKVLHEQYPELIDNSTGDIPFTIVEREIEFEEEELTKEPVKPVSEETPLKVTEPVKEQETKVAPPGAIKIADIGIANRIRGMVGKDIDEYLYQSDLDQVLTLTVPNMDLSMDLDGLQYCVNLQELYIPSQTFVKDLSPIKGLKKLKVLSLRSNYGGLGFDKVLDISALAQLHSLQYLTITVHTEIKDAGALGGLANLKELTFYVKELPDYQFLKDLTNLTKLNINSCENNDLSPLGELKNLEELTIGSGGISDIKPLSSLSNLKILDIRENAIQDINPLQNLTNLSVIHLEDNRIFEITGLLKNSGLGKGDVIHLKDNPLSYDAKNIDVPALRKLGVKVYL